MAEVGAAAGGTAIASPALANATPDIHWTLTSAFNQSLDIMFGAAETFAQTVSDLTDGHFTISTSGPDQIASPVDALTAVVDGKADCAHTALSYSWNTNPAYIFGTGAPFGMNARQHAAWLREGGGSALIDELLADRNLIAMPMGDTGAQMAGWFRKEVHSVADFAGMKVRIGGFAGKVLEVLGATPVILPKKQILDALRSGLLDAFEWAGPYDDAKFDGDAAEAISKVAPYYYYPGWWKGEMQLHLVLNKDKFFALSKTYQTALRAAASMADESVGAKYDAFNPAGLKRLVIGGAQLRLFPQEVLVACYKTSNDLYAQLGLENPRFKKLADSYMSFRSEEYLWWQVAEYSFDNFMIRERRAKG